jgi:glyceraldehyde-3-phosphate dehydrogenase/erythrose-4-phosphate dehydrogenase
MKGVLGYTEEPLVSIDYNGNTSSSTFDTTALLLSAATLSGWLPGMIMRSDFQ